MEKDPHTSTRSRNRLGAGLLSLDFRLVNGPSPEAKVIEAGLLNGKRHLANRFSKPALNFQGWGMVWAFFIGDENLPNIDRQPSEIRADLNRE